MDLTGKLTQTRGLDSNQIRGGLKMEDMIMLDFVKKSYFLDYDNVNRHLE